jgi:hypothetical protein
LYISNVVHQATISVDEKGTVATAATGIGMATPTVVWIPPPPMVFDADHPFLFLIRDDQSGAVLFMGQEMDPTSETGDPSAPPVGTAPPPGAAPPPPSGSSGVVTRSVYVLTPTLTQRERFELALGAQESGSNPTSTPQKTTPPPNDSGGTPGGTPAGPTTGTGSGTTGLGNTGSGSTGSSTSGGHGSHQFAATDTAVSDFDVADLYTLDAATA